jgi:hypothetical protein
LTDGTATISSGAVSGVASLAVDNVKIDGTTIGHTDDTDLMTLTSGTVTVAGTVAATTLTGDGSGITGVSASSIKADDLSAGDAAVTLQTSSGNITIDATANDADIIFKGTDNNSDITMLTLDGSEAGNASFNGDLTVTGNDITFGNGETISNATNGDFSFTTDVVTGALTLTNSNSANGIAALELVSDNGADAGDGYEVKSINGTFTITSDHSTFSQRTNSPLIPDNNIAINNRLT